MIYARQMQFLWCHLMRYVPLCIASIPQIANKSNRKTRHFFFLRLFCSCTDQQTHIRMNHLRAAVAPSTVLYSIRLCVCSTNLCHTRCTTAYPRQRIEIAKRSVKTFLDGIPITWKMQQIISPHKRQWSFVMYSRENEKRKKEDEKQTRNKICIKHIFGRFI